MHLRSRDQAQLFALAEGLYEMPELGSPKVTVSGWRLHFGSEAEAAAASAKWFGTDPVEELYGERSLWAVSFDDENAHTVVDGWLAGAAFFVER